MMEVGLLCVSLYGGVKLGSSRDFSATLGMGEMTELLAAFEEQNSCRIQIHGYLTKQNGKNDILWVAEAMGGEVGPVGQKRLAYANVRCLEKRLLTMEAVLLQLLYALDFQLGLRELEGTKIPEA